MAKLDRVPEFEPEVVAALARRKYKGDLDRAPTASTWKHEVRGVRLISSYSKAHELNQMAEVVEALPEHWLMLVRSIFCDSKTKAYAVDVKPCRVQDQKCLAELISELLIVHAGGHSGVSLGAGPHTGALIHPRRAAG